MARGVTGGTNLSITSHADLNVAAGDFTLCLWLYLNSFSGGYGNVFYKDGELAIYHSQSSGANDWAFVVGGDFTFQTPSVGINTGAWYHVLLRRSGSTVTFWLNGVSNASWTGSGTTTNANTIFMGESMGGGDNVDGSFAELAIWNDDLDDAEVAALAKAISPGLIRPGNIRLYMPLLGNDSPEVSQWRGHTASVNGASKQDHPRIYRAGGGISRRFTTAAVAASAPKRLLLMGVG